MGRGGGSRRQGGGGRYEAGEWENGKLGKEKMGRSGGSIGRMRRMGEWESGKMVHEVTFLTSR